MPTDTGYAGCKVSSTSRRMSFLFPDSDIRTSRSFMGFRWRRIIMFPSPLVLLPLDGLERQRSREQDRHRRREGHCKAAAGFQETTAVLLIFRN